MNFLNELGFNEKEIKKVEKETPVLIQKKCEEFKDIFKSNIEYLKELGVKNYKDVVAKYADMFLMDNSKFEAIFSKYDKEDLVEKLAKNISIIEHL